jgi:hypothetical protein
MRWRFDRNYEIGRKTRDMKIFPVVVRDIEIEVW